jgi:hypothetical protein
MDRHEELQYQQKLNRNLQHLMVLQTVLLTHGKTQALELLSLLQKELQHEVSESFNRAFPRP